MFGLRLTAPPVISSIRSISWLPYEAPLSERAIRWSTSSVKMSRRRRLAAEHVRAEGRRRRRRTAGPRGANGLRLGGARGLGRGLARGRGLRAEPVGRLAPASSLPARLLAPYAIVRAWLAVTSAVVERWLADALAPGVHSTLEEELRSDVERGAGAAWCVRFRRSPARGGRRAASLPAPSARATRCSRDAGHAARAVRPWHPSYRSIALVPSALATRALLARARASACAARSTRRAPTPCALRGAVARAVCAQALRSGAGCRGQAHAARRDAAARIVRISSGAVGRASAGRRWPRRGRRRLGDAGAASAPRARSRAAGSATCPRTAA